MTVSTPTLDAPLAVPTGYWTRARKTGAVLSVLGLIATVVFGLLATGNRATFYLGQVVQPDAAKFSIIGWVGAVVFGLIALGTGIALLITGQRFGLLVSVSLAAFAISAICWQLSSVPGGAAIPLGQLSHSTMEASIPLIFGALGGILCERSGVVNVAIEGQLLTGAFMAALVGTLAGSYWAALGAAAVGGALISLLLAVMAIKYFVDQVVIGIVLNFFALGLTGYLYEQVMRSDTTKYNNPGRLPTIEIPLLSKIPVIGPALFEGTILTYGAFAAVAIVAVALFRTRWGLRTRAVGEHPAAADTLGIKVLGMRYTNVLIGGLVAGFGGAYFAMIGATSFSKNITNGLGFIALAAMIFGRWHPIWAFLAAVFFGFAKAIVAQLGSVGTSIPNEFLNMLPYVATILAVTGLVGRVRAPAADGKPYVKG